MPDYESSLLLKTKQIVTCDSTILTERVRECWQRDSRTVGYISTNRFYISATHTLNTGTHVD